VPRSIYELNIEDIVREVRDCDRRIVKWLSAHNTLSPKEYIKIHRPDLVRIRLDVMHKLGIVEFNEEGSAYLNGIVEIDNLPVNSDRIKVRSKMVLVTYKVIKDYNPRNLLSVQQLIAEVTGKEFSIVSIVAWVKALKKMGLIKKDGDKYVATYDIYTDDYDVLFNKWKAESGAISELGRRMAVHLREAKRKKRKEADSE